MNTCQFFDLYYKNADVNCILIMDAEGNIIDVNNAFTKNFGYQTDEISGKNFSILFNEEDILANKPKLELQKVLATGQADDENYIIDSIGRAVWCTGEALLISTPEGVKYIVKDIVNLQAKKQLQLFLKETEEILEQIFYSSGDVPMIILDGSLKVQRTNRPFLDLFEISIEPAVGSRITDLNHPFWKRSELKSELSKIIIDNEPFKNKEFLLQTSSGEKSIILDSKIIDGVKSAGKKIFIIIQDASASKNSSRRANTEHSKNLDIRLRNDSRKVVNP